MKRKIIKNVIVIMPVIGIMLLFFMAFAGKIAYGWIIFLALLLISGIVNILFFKCPHCKKVIPANGNLNQKYCPLCGEDLGMKPSRLGYYSACKCNKHGRYKAYTIVGPMAFIVSFGVIMLILAVILGFDSIFKGMGRFMVLAAVILAALLGLFCRCAVGSIVMLDDTYLYFSRIPFRWKKYELSLIKETVKKYKPFYHPARGYVIAAGKNVIVLPVSMYKGGQEFLSLLTEKIGEAPVDIRPEDVVAKHSEEGKAAEQKYHCFVDAITGDK